MDLIYLDYNCFQRGFDDPRQIKIQLEALACAYQAKCKIFLTCDDELLKRVKRLNLEIKVINPVDYIREVDK